MCKCQMTEQFLETRLLEAKISKRARIWEKGSKAHKVWSERDRERLAEAKTKG